MARATTPTVIEGPHFVYSLSPRLFSGRPGRGPLEVVWDTNILIDYLTHGHDPWDERGWQVTDDEYAAELDGLAQFLNLWMRRDIRIRVLDRSITDAKKTLARERQMTRARAVDEIAAALRLDGWADEGRDNRHDAAPWQHRSAVIEAALQRIPAGADRELVRECLQADVHVFLTRDQGILRAGRGLAVLGLWIASPLDTLEELIGCGAFLAVTHPQTAYWPLPDLQRSSHLIQALPPAD